MKKTKTVPLFIQGIPKDVKMAFKSACVVNGKSMRDTIIELMRSYGKRNQSVSTSGN